MLPNYIIDEIKRREKEKDLSEELFIDCPLPERRDDRAPNTADDEASNDRGVVILDFSL